MKKYILVCSFPILFFSCNPKSDVNPCVEFDALDLAMNNIYRNIRSQHAVEEKFLKRFIDAQVFWIQYRNRHIRALYPGDFDDFRKKYGKPVFNACKCKELSRLTKIRIEELKMWFDPEPENQSECPDSRN